MPDACVRVCAYRMFPRGQHIHVRISRRRCPGCDGAIRERGLNQWKEFPAKTKGSSRIVGCPHAHSLQMSCSAALHVAFRASTAVSRSPCCCWLPLIGTSMLSVFASCLALRTLERTFRVFWAGFSSAAALTGCVFFVTRSSCRRQTETVLSILLSSCGFCARGVRATQRAQRTGLPRSSRRLSDLTFELMLDWWLTWFCFCWPGGEVANRRRARGNAGER